METDVANGVWPHSPSNQSELRKSAMDTTDLELLREPIEKRDKTLKGLSLLVHHNSTEPIHSLDAAAVR